MSNRPAQPPPPESQPTDPQAVHRRLQQFQAGLASDSPPLPEQQRILHERARVLAQPPEAVSTQADIELVAFLLAKERYGVESAHVREVVVVKELTPLPTTPPFVVGIFHLRGQIISVIDLKNFFGLPPAGPRDAHTILILQSPAMEFGVLIDGVLGVERVPRDALQPSLPTLTGVRQEYLKGLTPDRMAVLDGAKLLADRKLIVDEETAERNRL